MKQMKFLIYYSSKLAVFIAELNIFQTFSIVVLHILCIAFQSTSTESLKLNYKILPLFYLVYLQNVKKDRIGMAYDVRTRESINYFCSLASRMNDIKKIPRFAHVSLFVLTFIDLSCFRDFNVRSVC